MLRLGEAVGIGPKGVIKGLAGNIGPVRRECLFGAGAGIDIGGYIPGFRIRQLGRIVPGAKGHVVLYVSGQAAQAEKTGADSVAVGSPEGRIDIMAAVRIERAGALRTVTAGAF